MGTETRVTHSSVTAQGEAHRHYPAWHKFKSWLFHCEQEPDNPSELPSLPVYKVPDQSDHRSLPALPTPQSHPRSHFLQETSPMEDDRNTKKALPGAIGARRLVLQGSCLLRCSCGGGWLAASKKHPMWKSQGGDERQDPFPQLQFLPQKPSSPVFLPAASTPFPRVAAAPANTALCTIHGCLSAIHF